MELVGGILLAAYGTVYTLSIIGNTLVCSVIKKEQSMRNTTNLLLVALAIVDLLSSLSGTTVLLFENGIIPHPSGKLGDVFCKAVTGGTITYIAIQTSELTLCVLAVDRYFSICHPLKSNLRIRKRHLKFLIPCLWLTGTLTYVQYISVTRGNNGLPCYDEYPSKLAGNAIAFCDFTLYCGLPLIIFMFCYSSIVISIWKPKLIDTSEGSTERRRRQLKTTRILLTVTIMFCICVVPSYMNLLYKVTTTNAFTLKYDVYLFLLHMHAAINPFIYMFQSSQFKTAVVQAWRRRQNAVTPSENSLEMENHVGEDSKQNQKKKFSRKAASYKSKDNVSIH